MVVSVGSGFKVDAEELAKEIAVDLYRPLDLVPWDHHAGFCSGLGKIP